MKENTKNQIKTLIDFVNEKGNTMTIANIANVNESIDSIYLRLGDSEEDFPEKDAVIEHLKYLSELIRKTPYFNLVSFILIGLNEIMGLLK